MRLVSLLFALVVYGFNLPPLAAQENAGWLRSAKSGAWSAPFTWEGGKVPGAGARVHIRPGHAVLYDVDSPTLLRAVNVGGTLSFARDRNTRMDVGLLRIAPGDAPSEEGFDCDGHAMDSEKEAAQAALEVGTPNEPIPAKFTALIRLAHIAGTNKESLPALVCCGGRMDLHGSPLSRTWVRLGATAKKGESVVTLGDGVGDWKIGDRVILTATQGDRSSDGSFRKGRPTRTEERTIKALENSTGAGNLVQVTLDRPLDFDHLGEGDFRGAAANLSRNVIIESADPNGIRGHTMYHRGSSGAISYAEFRHLGKENVLGRYSIHYHLCGNSMRGSYVLGASIWDSHNRWVTIHGTNYLVVRDCVGYQSIGHGFFLEDGTETLNVLDRNLAVQAYKGKRLPQQILRFDQNEGAGFWWANSLNTFTNNLTCENDRYGYRFEATQTSEMKLTLPLLQPDGTRKLTDIRTLPFIRCDDNEACCDGLYGFNLGEGVNRVGPDERHPFIIRNLKLWDIHYAFRPQSPCVLAENVMIHRAVYGVYHPNYDRHVYKNMTISDTNSEPFNRGHDDLSIQYGPLAVDGLTFASLRNSSAPMIQLSDDNPTGKAETHIRGLKLVNNGAKRPVIDTGVGPKPTPKTPTSVPIFVHDWFGPGIDAKVVRIKSADLKSDGFDYQAKPPFTGPDVRVAEVKGTPFPKLLDPVDDLPPVTVITRIIPQKNGKLLVKGTASDNGAITKVLVNGQNATPLRPNFAEWQATVEARGEVIAHAEDAAGNVEKTPHRVMWGK
jgi:G8 domain